MRFYRRYKHSLIKEMTPIGTQEFQKRKISSQQLVYLYIPLTCVTRTRPGPELQLVRSVSQNRKSELQSQPKFQVVQ